MEQKPTGAYGPRTLGPQARTLGPQVSVTSGAKKVAAAGKSGTHHYRSVSYDATSSISVRFQPVKRHDGGSQSSSTEALDSSRIYQRTTSLPGTLEDSSQQYLPVPTMSLESSSGGPSRASTVSIPDDVAVNRLSIQKQLEQLGQSESLKSYLSQRGLLIVFLVDPNMRKTRKRILAALKEKEGQYKKRGRKSLVQKSSFSSAEQDLKKLLDKSIAIKIKKGKEGARENLRLKTLKIVDEVDGIFPAFQYPESVNSHMWDKDTVEDRKKASVCVSHTDFKKHMMSLSEMLKYFHSKYGVEMGELTAPGCDIKPEFVLPALIADYDRAQYYIPLKVVFTRDGKQVGIPHGCYKKLASLLFIRLHALKEFSVSKKENWDKLSKDAQEIVGGEIHNDDKSFQSDACRFNCEIKTYVGDDLPLSPVFSSSAYLQAYQKNVEDKIDKLQQIKLAKKTVEAEKTTKKVTKLERDKLRSEAIAEVKKTYSDSYATGQQVMAVLEHVLKLPESASRLVTEFISQGTFNEITLYCINKLFPACNIPIYFFCCSEDLVKNQQLQVKMEVNDWGELDSNDKCIELRGAMYFDRFRAAVSDEEALKAESFLTIRVLAACNKDKVVITQVEIDIDTMSDLDKSQSTALKAREEQIISSAKAIGDATMEVMKDRNNKDKISAALNSQYSNMAEAMVLKPQSISNYVASEDEKDVITSIIAQEYGKEEDKEKVEDKEKNKVAAVAEVLKTCKTIKFPDFGISHRIPRHIGDFRDDDKGESFCSSADECRLISTKKDGWVATNIAEAETLPYEGESVVYREMSFEPDSVDSEDDPEERPTRQEMLIEQKRRLRYRRSMLVRKKMQELAVLSVSDKTRKKICGLLEIDSRSNMMAVMPALESYMEYRADNPEWEQNVRVFCKLAHIKEQDVESVLNYGRCYYSVGLQEQATTSSQMKRFSRSYSALQHLGTLHEDQDRVGNSKKPHQRQLSVPLLGDLPPELTDVEKQLVSEHVKTFLKKVGVELPGSETWIDVLNDEKWELEDVLKNRGFSQERIPRILSKFENEIKKSEFDTAV